MPADKYKRIRLKIDGYTPHTLPMGRLADYLRDLADLLGAESDAHLIEVGEGSAALVHDLPYHNYLAVQERVIAAAEGRGPKQAVRGYIELKVKLRQDAKPAQLVDDESGRAVLEFPLPEAGPLFGPVTQPGSLEGVLIKLGGRDETVPVHLQDGGEYYKCTASRALAKELRNQLFEKPIRVNGVGKWIRGEDGEWTLDSFKISSWEPLSDEALEVILARMRAVESDWDKIDDPLAELRRIRKGDTKPN
jgi:hypothetical protein